MHTAALPRNDAPAVRPRPAGVDFRPCCAAAAPKYWSQAHGSPASEGVSVFFVAGGKLVFLRRADMPTVTTVNHGPIIAMQLPSYGRPTQRR